MVKAYISLSGDRADAYRLLAWAYRETFGGECPEIQKDARGKPRFPSRPDLHFSISHTRGIVMAALADSPCGCDVERLRPVSPSAVRYACREEELSDFEFLDLWTLKESWIKLTGYLPCPHRDIVFRRAPSRILCPDPALNAALYPLPNARSALICASPLPDALISVPNNLIKPLAFSLKV